MSSKLSGTFLRKKRLNECLQRTVDFSVCRQKKPYFGKNYPYEEIIQGKIKISQFLFNMRKNDNMKFCLGLYYQSK